MSVVGSEPEATPVFSLDETVMHAPEIMPEAKSRRTVRATQLDIDSPSLKIPQAEDDNQSVRRKLCDSLTSALEMVVSKQLVKSVLGVVNDVDAVEAGNLCRHAQLKAQEGLFVENRTQLLQSSGGMDFDLRGGCCLLVDRIIENRARSQHGVPARKESVNMDLDFGSSCNDEAERREDGNRACFASFPVTDESQESPVPKSNSRSERLLVPQNAMSGLELMEKAKKVARSVELNLFSFNGGVNKKYKEKARSLLFNLKDKSNPELRARVFDGEIAPRILVRMSPEQLASKQLSKWRTDKAQEFASMVVLTDTDLDPRRIVKKTHKGEFQFASEEIDFSASTRGSNPGRIISGNVDEGTGYKRLAYPSPTRIGGCGTKLKVSNNSCSEDDRILGQSQLLSSFQERVENEPLAKEGTSNSIRSHPCTVDAHNCHISEIAEEHPSATWVEDGTLDTLDLTRIALNRRDKILSEFLVSYPNYCPPKLSKIPSTRCTGSEVVRSSVSETSAEGCEAALWEGSIQLSATRVALISGFYESGERLELRDWPRSVEVKGRVRLVILVKFLQDLQLSRSRTVTILSVCPSERQGEAKQSAAYLKEMADHYRIGGRAGFVEPRPGFELYLLSPSSMSFKPSSPEDLGSLKAATKREDGVLLGVVVWRKSQPQGVPLTRESDENISVKEVPFSNLVLQSHTKIDVRPSQGIETQTSEGWLPTSQKTATAPSLVYVRGYSSMHDRGDTSNKRNAPIGRDWHPISPLAIDHRAPTVVSPLDQETKENAHGAVTKSVSLLHELVDLGEIPPGFLPRPVETSPDRSASPVGDSENAGQGCQAALAHPGSVTGQDSLLPLESREISNDIPPGFLYQPSVNVEGIPTPNLEDDDDLPEFNFDVEGVVLQAISYPKLPSHLLSHSTHDFASESFARFMNEPIHRYHGHRRNAYDLHPRGLEVPPVPGGHPLGNKSQHEDSLPQSVASVPTLGGSSRPETRDDSGTTMLRDVSVGVLPSRGYHRRSPQMTASSQIFVTDKESMFMAPMNGTDQRRSQLREACRCAGVGEQETFVFDHGSAYPIPVPPKLTSSQFPFPNQAKDKVTEHFYPSIDIPQQHTASLLSHAMLPSIPSVSEKHPLHPRRERSLVHMVVEHQQSMMMKRKNFDWRPSGVPFPQQEPWRDPQQDMGTCYPSAWQELDSVRYYRSESLYRKSVQKDTYGVDEDSSVTRIRSGREEGKGIRERNKNCSRMQRDLKTRVNMTVTPTGANGESESMMMLREPKSLKRVRERERDQ